VVETPERIALVVVDDGPVGAALVQAITSATISVEWARSLCELRSRSGQDPALVVFDLELAETCPDALLTLVLDTFAGSTVVALAGDLTGERGAKLLGQGVPSLPKPVCPQALAVLVLQLMLDRRTDPTPGAQRSSHLESVMTSYANTRALSKQQQMIFRLYLSGMSDKGIAETCNCSAATVYEHWRRMARKAGGTHKGDAIADFHRFLAGD
jgi:DNA-binding NarL/FixJ family response regulator